MMPIRNYLLPKRGHPTGFSVFGAKLQSVRLRPAFGPGTDRRPVVCLIANLGRGHPVRGATNIDKQPQIHILLNTKDAVA